MRTRGSLGLRPDLLRAASAALAADENRTPVIRHIAVIVGSALIGLAPIAQAQSNCATGAAVSDPAVNAGLVADCETLLAVQHPLAGTAALNWSADLAIRSWDGVEVTGTPSRVTSLRLVYKGLSGSLPSELGSLSNLTRLELFANDLTGSLPSELGNLSNLTTLLLGTLPSARTPGNVKWTIKPPTSPVTSPPLRVRTTQRTPEQ